MAITLTPETEARLRERAEQSGQDISLLADSIIADVPATDSTDVIARDEQGRPIIAGRSLRVAQIALDSTFHDLTPNEIAANYPNLTLAQVHAALSYYYEHQTEIDGQIAEADRFVEGLRANHVPHITRAELEERRQAALEQAAV